MGRPRAKHITLCWLAPLLFMDCTQGTSALAQASALNSDHLTGHEAGGRTPRHGQTVMASAEVGERGEVGMHLRQSQEPGQSPVTSTAREVVYGRLAFLAHAPSSFISDNATKTATQTAVGRVAVQPDPQPDPQQAKTLSVRKVEIATALLPDVQMGVKVDFMVAFRSVTDQEVFTQTVAADGGHYMVRNISGSVPAPNRGRCQQLSLIESGSDGTSLVEQGQMRKPYGTVRFKFPKTFDMLFETIRTSLDTVAQQIAQRLGVTEEKVGLLLVLDPPNAVLLFWSNGASQAVINKLEADQDFFENSFKSLQPGGLPSIEQLAG